jgi:hypothetical protein
MKGWWPRNPWRGMSIRERRRLFRLSASCERINDPQDPQLVHNYLVYMEWYNGTVGWRFINSVGPFLVIPMFGVGLVLWALRGDGWRSVFDAAVLAAYVLPLRRGWTRRQHQRQTAEVNGWDDLG